MAPAQAGVSKTQKTERRKTPRRLLKCCSWFHKHKKTERCKTRSVW